MKHVVDFLEEVELLKIIDRSGYRYSGIKDPETVAEHTLGVVWYAITIAGLMQVDQSKVMMMALVHDLAEVRLGDIVQPAVEHYLGKEKKVEMEKQAFDDIVAHLPDVQQKVFTQSFDDFEEGKSIEAQIVRDAENYRCLVRFSRTNANMVLIWLIFGKMQRVIRG